jgi:adenylate cyclase
MVTQDVRLTAEDTNLTVNTRSATEAETILTYTRSNVLMFLHALELAPALTGDTADFFFRENRGIAALVLGDGAPADSLMLSESFFVSNEADPDLISSFMSMNADAFDRAAAGETIILNAAPVFEISLLVMFIPLETQARSAAVFFSSDSLAEALGTGVNVSYIINDAADVLVHPDHSLVLGGENLSGNSFIRSIMEGDNNSRQMLYTGDEGNRFFGAFTRLSLGGLTVITTVEYDIAFEGIVTTTRRNIMLTSGVLFLSVLCVWFFSKTISGPLKALAKAAGRIEQGEFEQVLVSKSHDEVGLLTETFVKMGQGLAERERLRDTFGKFINKDIAERAMRGDISLGGEAKEVTIFFSDIRSFTEISEKLEPHEVVEFLNEYMTRMVECVNKTGGVVDKFIGDAVMAVWGAPVSAGSSARDALNCVRAALMMRVSLKEFNRDRGGDRKPLIRIGCGISTGNVLAGQIGSSERMEYTVIGDPVNLASRTESLNKPLGTDILITENTWDLIKEYIISEEMPPVRVKGKAKPIRMFAVINLKVSKPDTPQPAPASLEELRKILGIEAPDLAKVDVNGEERKYKIGGDAG